MSGPTPDRTTGLPSAPPMAETRIERGLRWTTALLVVAQAAVVGLQVVGRHLLHRPIPWTEEVARLLLVWLMCVGRRARAEARAASAGHGVRCVCCRNRVASRSIAACGWC